MKIHIELPLDDIDNLKLAHDFFSCGSDEVLSGTQLVSWAVQMVIAAYEHEA